MTHPVNVLLIEDSPADVLFTRHAFKGLPFVFTVATDGKQGVDTAIEMQPALILLDLNLPRLRGDDVLRALKAHPATQHIPVVVLTSSDSTSDIEMAYTLNCASYVTKPATPHKFREFAEASNAWWVTYVSLPEDTLGV